jgi:acetylornithine deacetylase
MASNTPPLDVIELTMALCHISSLTNDESKVMAFVCELLVEKGFEVKRQQVGPMGRDNLYAQWPNSKPSVLLTTHLDVVPPYFPPRRSDDGEWLIGRGVCDAKGIAAAMICAALALLQDDILDVALLFVVGEETSSDGAKAAVHQFLPSMRYIIDGEPTDLKLASAMKGAIVFELEAHGRSGHSAYPESGHSAVHQLSRDVHAILQHDWPSSDVLGSTTVNIGRIEGGVAPNVIAAHALARGVMRTTADAKDLADTLKQLIDPTCVLRVLSSSSPFIFNSISGFDTCVVGFGCDVPHLSSMGIPLLIGPGSILEAHTAGEKIRVAELHEAVSVYQKLCRQLLEE